MVQVTAHRIRDAILLTLGTGGMINQLFITRQPSGLLIGASLIMIGGSAVLNAWVLGRSALLTPSPPSTPTVPSSIAATGSSPSASPPPPSPHG